MICAQDIAQRTNYTPNVGAVTSKILLNVLSDHGLHETALRVATTTDEPSCEPPRYRCHLGCILLKIAAISLLTGGKRGDLVKWRCFLGLWRCPSC